jgi:hypothetical protein
LLRYPKKMPSRTRIRRDSILQGGQFGFEFGRGLIIAERYGVDEGNEPILLALSGERFSSVGQILLRIAFQNAA